MKLSQYAQHIGVSYKTAWRWWKAGKLPHPAKQSPSGTVLVDFTPQNEYQKKDSVKVAIYARVSSSENKSNLETQVDRLTQYSIAKGYSIVKIVKEIGSGLNDNRKKLNGLLESDEYDVLLVEHKDRLARFGTGCISILFKRLNIKLEIVNQTDNGQDELMQDLIAIITSFAARLYGQRRSKRKTEKIIEALQNEDY